MSQRLFVVRVIGLEPTHLAAPDPKSGVSTNFTTPAVDQLQNKCLFRYCGCKYTTSSLLCKRKLKFFKIYFLRIFDHQPYIINFKWIT